MFLPSSNENRDCIFNTGQEYWRTFGVLVVMVTSKASQVGQWAKDSCVKPYQFSCLTKPLTGGSVHIKIPSTSSQRE